MRQGERRREVDREVVRQREREVRRMGGRKGERIGRELGRGEREVKLVLPLSNFQTFSHAKLTFPCTVKSQLCVDFLDVMLILRSGFTFTVTPSRLVTTLTDKNSI